MTIKINTYLTFNGNCKEAMIFYQECFGGELTFQTIEESPMSAKLPKEMKECILHATLTNKGFVIMGSDITSEIGLIRGNSISLMLNFKSEADIKSIFDKLSNGGTIHHPLENTFYGTIFGDLQDKFGNNWLLNFDKKTNNNLKK